MTATLLFCPLLLQASTTPPACFEDVQKHFFQSTYVLDALSMHGVPQGQWIPINSDIQSRQLDIPRLVKEWAGTMHPNPLSPYNKYDAARLLMAVLYDLFKNVVLTHYVFNESDIRQMFYYIRGKNLDKLKACFGNNIPDDWYREKN